jgi:hypothetical protein
VDAAGPAGSTHQGARHRRRLQTRWWTLSDPPAAPSGGPPSTTSSTSTCHRCHLQNSVVDAAGPADTAPPRGDRHRRLTASGSRCQYPLPTPPTGPLVDYHYWACYKQDILREIFLDPCDAKDSKKRNREEDIVQCDKKQSLFTKQKMLMPQVQARSPMLLQAGARTAQL